jgi:SHS2 domain-containing protein
VNPQYEILEHPSDLGIEIRGRTMADTFQYVSLGLMSVIAGTLKIESSAGISMKVAQMVPVGVMQG